MKQFDKVEQQRVDAIAKLITGSGLSAIEIAKATGVERRTVKRAAKGGTVHFRTAVRLEYFLERYLREYEMESRKYDPLDAKLVIMSRWMKWEDIGFEDEAHSPEARNEIRKNAVSKYHDDEAANGMI